MGSMRTLTRVVWYSIVGIEAFQREENRRQRHDLETPWGSFTVKGKGGKMDRTIILRGDEVKGRNFFY